MANQTDTEARVGARARQTHAHTPGKPAKEKTGKHGARNRSLHHTQRRVGGGRQVRPSEATARADLVAAELGGGGLFAAALFLLLVGRRWPVEQQESQRRAVHLAHRARRKGRAVLPAKGGRTTRGVKTALERAAERKDDSPDLGGGAGRGRAARGVTRPTGRPGWQGRRRRHQLLLGQRLDLTPQPFLFRRQRSGGGGGLVLFAQ